MSAGQDRMITGCTDGATAPKIMEYGKVTEPRELARPDMRRGARGGPFHWLVMDRVDRISRGSSPCSPCTTPPSVWPPGYLVTDTSGLAHAWSILTSRSPSPGAPILQDCSCGTQYIKLSTWVATPSRSAPKRTSAHAAPGAPGTTKCRRARCQISFGLRSDQWPVE